MDRTPDTADGIFQRIARRLDDLINPIAVKEMRQAVAGKTIVGVIILFLVVQTVVVAFYMLDRSAGGVSQGEGADLFMIVLMFLLGTCMLFVPTSTAYRLASERSDDGGDLMFITTLNPWRIISGKFSSAMVMTLLIHALCLPYITLAYLLRGIDMVSIFTVLGVNLVIIAWCVMVAIFVACLPMSKFLRMGAQLATLGLFIGVFVYSVNKLAWEVIHGSQVSWDWILLFAACFAGMSLILFTLSVAAVSPSPANRALLPRVCFTLVWLGVGVAFYFTALDDFIVWAWLAMVGLGLALVAAIGERDHLNRRLAATVPPNPVLRIPAFLFYSGAAGGIVWTLALMIATLVIIRAVADFPMGVLRLSTGGWYTPSSSLSGIRLLDLHRLEVFAWLCLTYALLGFMLVRFTPLSKWVHPAHTFVIALLLMGVGSIWPAIASVLVDGPMSRQVPDSWWITSLYAALGSEIGVTREALAPVRVFAIAAVLSISPWLVKRMIAFRPLARDGDAAAPEAASELPSASASAAAPPRDTDDPGAPAAAPALSEEAGRG